MKICAISDLHGHLPELPECDVVCICGDIVPLQLQRYILMCLEWFKQEFIPWAENLDCKKVIMIAGNHDFIFDQDKYYLESTKKDVQDFIEEYLTDGKIKYLQDESYEFEGKTFYGTPWCPELPGWAFCRPSEFLTEKFNLITDRVDVLITHTPPKTLDMGKVLQKGLRHSGTDFGSKELVEVTTRRDIKWAFCGHVHSGSHVPHVEGGTKYVNVSLKDENYDVNYKPFTVDIA